MARSRTASPTRRASINRATRGITSRAIPGMNRRVSRVRAATITAHAAMITAAAGVGAEPRVRKAGAVAGCTRGLVVALVAAVRAASASGR